VGRIDRKKIQALVNGQGGITAILPCLVS